MYVPFHFFSPIKRVTSSQFHHRNRFMMKKSTLLKAVELHQRNWALYSLLTPLAFQITRKWRQVYLHFNPFQNHQLRHLCQKISIKTAIIETATAVFMKLQWLLMMSLSPIWPILSTTTIAFEHFSNFGRLTWQSMSFSLTFRSALNNLDSLGAYLLK